MPPLFSKRRSLKKAPSPKATPKLESTVKSILNEKHLQMSSPSPVKPVPQFTDMPGIFKSEKQSPKSGVFSKIGRQTVFQVSNFQDYLGQSVGSRSPVLD
jgi:hypothetical protein